MYFLKPRRWQTHTFRHTRTKLDYSNTTLHTQVHHGGLRTQSQERSMPAVHGEGHAGLRQVLRHLLLQYGVQAADMAVHEVICGR